MGDVYRLVVSFAVVAFLTGVPVFASGPPATPPLELTFTRPPMEYEVPPPPGRAPSGFTITLNFTGGLTAEQQNQFIIAKQRWESRITGYEAGVALSGITIDASGTTIDGAGGILGQAGPTRYTLQDRKYFTTRGIMQFDSADIAAMMANGSFDDVVEHEMGHVLGLGIWWTNDTGYVDGSGRYTGSYGLAAYRAEFLGQSGAAYVPVELDGGSGTANGHWDEVAGGAAMTGRVDASGHDMRNELMTGWLNMPTFCSNTTIQSLRDVGFTVADTNTANLIFEDDFEGGSSSAWITAP